MQFCFHRAWVFVSMLDQRHHTFHVCRWAVMFSEGFTWSTDNFSAASQPNTCFLLIAAPPLKVLWWPWTKVFVFALQPHWKIGSGQVHWKCNGNQTAHWSKLHVYITIPTITCHSTSTGSSFPHASVQTIDKAVGQVQKIWFWDKTTIWG